MRPWTWFMLIGVMASGLIARYSFTHGDPAWGAVAAATAVLVGFIMFYDLARPADSATPAAPAKPKRCSASSGLLMGYQCELDKGHEGKHEAVTSRSTDTFSGREVGRTTVTW